MSRPGRGRSRLVYRVLLGAYAAKFRARFANDLLADFSTMLAERGPSTAWRRAAIDLLQSLPSTHVDARTTSEGARRYRGDSAMSSLWFDMRFAFRGLVKAPIFTIVTIATLALGIGANSAIFSLVNAVLLRPLGYARRERLMFIYEGIPAVHARKITVSPPDFIDLTSYQRSFTAIGAYQTQSYELSGVSRPEQIVGVRVSASLLPILGVQTAIGRSFLESEDQPGHDVAILSYGLWQSRFGGSAGVVGQRVTLDRRPYTVVGVMPATFEFPKRGPQFNGEPAQIWTPLALAPFERQARGMMYNHSVIGRLRDGVTVDQAAADTRALADRFWPGEDPIGKRLKWGIAISTVPWKTVVGVVGDVVDGRLGDEPILHVYVPYAEMPDGLLNAPTPGLGRQMRLSARSEGDAAMAIAPMRAAVAALDPALAVADATTMTHVMSDASAPQRFSTIVLATFAVGALLLAGIGLYGVLAFGVAQRTREIGVRIALGATRAAVLRLIVRQGMMLTALGLLFGIAGALTATRVMTSLLYNTEPFDLVTFVGVPLIVGVVAMLAC